MYDVKNLCVDNTTLEHMYDIICATEDVTSTLSSHNLYDIISTSGMTSHPLYQTSNQLYLCQHNLSTDITPTFAWHHTHYICDIICTIYNIISTAYVITLFYLWQHKLDIWNHIEYAAQNMHYIELHIQSLCHYSTVLMTSQTLYMKPHPVCTATYTLYMRHHSHYLCLTPTV